MAIWTACAMTMLASALAGAVAAQDCRLALVLALDVSSSVDAAEDKLQREGLAGALASPEVIEAFLIGDPVALYVFEWSDAAFQRPLLPGWRIIESEADLLRVAEHVLRHQPRPEDLPYVRTAIGVALGHAAEAFAAGPDCRTRTIDVAGDGESNDGIAPGVAYRTFLLDDVTVNALIVGPLGTPSDPEDPAAERRVTWDYHRLVSSFQLEVLHGPGAFWVFADGYKDYQRAMTAKLLHELELPVVSGWPAGEDAG